MTDVVDLVHRRHDVLAALADGPKRKPELTEATSRSRSTIDRAVGELVDADLLRCDGSEYRLATAGRWIVEEYRTFRETSDTYYDARDAIVGVPASEQFPAAVLDGARIELATPEMPSRTAKLAHEGMREADRIYSTCAMLQAYQAEFWYAAVPDLAVDLEIVYARPALDAIHEEYDEMFQEFLDTGQVTAHVGDVPTSYSFAVVEGVADAVDGSQLVLGVHTDTGSRSVIVNDDPAAVEWGRETHRSLVAEAEQVHP